MSVFELRLTMRLMCSQNGSGDDFDDDGLFDLLTRFQSRRIDDQRCSMRQDQPSPDSDESRDIRLGERII